MDKIAIRNISTDVRGNQVVEYIDANTGDPLPSAEGYQIVDDWQNGRSTNSNAYSNMTMDAGVDTEEPEPFWQRYRDQGNGDISSHYGDRDTTASNNFGYVDKPKGMGLISALLPGPLGMAAKGVNMAINAGNTHSTNKAREYLGLEDRGLMSNVGSTFRDKKGYVGDVQFENNPNTYAVGLDAQDDKKRTTMTPDEARTRGMLAGGLSEATRDQTKQNIKDFKTDKKATLEQVPMGSLSLPQNSAWHGLGLGDYAPKIDTPEADAIVAKQDQLNASVPTKGLKESGKALSGVSGLAVHHTGGHGTVQGVVNTLNERGLGVQYVMDRDGTIYSTGPEDEKRSHIRPAENGTDLSNANTIGIEVIANDDKDLTPEQVASGKNWINTEIGKNPDIGLNVFGHGELNSHKQDTEGMSIVNAYRAERDDPLNRPATPTPRPDQETMTAWNDDRQTSPEARGFTKPDAVPSYDSMMASTGVPNTGRFANLSPEERGLMGKTLAGEIDRSQTDLSTEDGRKEAQGILSSIENRVSKYGSVTGAIQAPNQFSTWNNPAAANTATKNYEADPKTFDSIVDSYVGDPSQNLGFTSYHNQKVNPSWSAKMENPTTIGPHTFGTLPEYTAKAPPSVQPHTVFNTAAITSPTFAGKMADDSLPSFSGRTETVANRPATSTSPTSNSSGTGFAKSSNDTASNTSSGSSRSAGLMSSMSTPSASTKSSLTDKDKTTSGGWGQRSY